MARKRKRLALRADGFLLVALIVNVIAGILYSPMTSVVRVRVIGAEEFDVQRLRSQLETLQDVPFFKIHPRLVESAALGTPEAEDVDFSRNIFGRAQLKITYKKPVAQIVVGKSDQLGEPVSAPPVNPTGSGTANKNLFRRPRHLVLSVDGSMYPSYQSVFGMALVRLPKGASQPALTLAVEPPLAALGEVCQSLPADLKQRRVIVLFRPDKGLCLNIENSSALVILGTSDKLDDKLQALIRLLQEHPDLLQESTEINLMDPINPMQRLKGRKADPTPDSAPSNTPAPSSDAPSEPVQP